MGDHFCHSQRSGCRHSVSSGVRSYHSWIVDGERSIVTRFSDADLARLACFEMRRGEGSIDVSVFEALQGQFHHDVTRGLWTLIEPTPVLLQQVRALFARLDRSVFLRWLDAVHLITAKAEHLDRLYSNDTHLLAACPSVHLNGINPIAPTNDR